VSAKTSLERAALAAASATGLSALARRLNGRRAVIAMYHGFTDRRAHDGIANHEWKHLPAEEFRAQLSFLARHYDIVPLDALVRACAAGGPLPARAAVITIDDGYRSVYEIAYPILREFRAPAAVFLATGFVDAREFLWTDRVEYAIDRAPAGTIDVGTGGERLRLEVRDAGSRIAADRAVRGAIKRLPQDGINAAVEALERAAGRSLAVDPDADAIYQPLTWAQTREMAESGLVAFGSHTHNHVILSRCDEARIVGELDGSRRTVEHRLGRPCRLFCYPNGRRGDFNAVTKRLVQSSGYSCALTTVYGATRPGADPYELTRYNLGRRLGPGEMAGRLAGLLG
jgi:peptidoglycan/xylan/chitin deacetylase (PgdA/CDA1 family)